MNLLTRLIRFLFLVKEIISKEGVVHFRRWRLIQTPWFALYLHKICQSDKDLDMHDHPWNFQSLIVKGAYREACKLAPKFDYIHLNSYYPGDVVKHQAEDAHKITLLTKEVWTLVFTSGRTRVWGYQTPQGWVDHKEYRRRKNNA
jgi:hypothetical protein